MRYSIFGESHGPAIGVVLEDVPAGLELDWKFIRSEMGRRKPGKDSLSTQRREDDEVEVLSGVFEGKTTGTPCAPSSATATNTPATMKSSKTCPAPVTATMRATSVTTALTTTAAAGIFLGG